MFRSLAHPRVENLITPLLSVRSLSSIRLQDNSAGMHQSLRPRVKKEVGRPALQSLNAVALLLC